MIIATKTAGAEAPFCENHPSTSEARYAGDITAREAWQRLQADASAQLVDVRTPEEWQAGFPDLSDAGKHTAKISWKLRTPSTYDRNPKFAEELAARVPDKDTPLFFMCKGGGRSSEAAAVMTQLGFTHCYNIIAGFEGGQDASTSGERGWRAASLPITREG